MLLLYELVYCFFKLRFGIWFGMHFVYAWYTKMTKTLNVTENVWSDFTYAGICQEYKKWYMKWYKVFIIPIVFSIPEAMRNVYYCYMAGIRLHCIQKMIFCCGFHCHNHQWGLYLSTWGYDFVTYGRVFMIKWPVCLNCMQSICDNKHPENINTHAILLFMIYLHCETIWSSKLQVATNFKTHKSCCQRLWQQEVHLKIVTMHGRLTAVNFTIQAGLGT